MTSRPLTDGEIALARTVFGDSIDYAQVKIHDQKYAFFHAEGTAMTPHGQLYMYGCYCEDYSRQKRAFFIHEMVHVWQYQNGILDPVTAAIEINLKHKFNYAAAYFFRLEEDKDLTRYGMEQQASIIEEFFAAAHDGNTAYSPHCENACDADEKMRLYKKVLGNFLKNPSYARPPGR